MITVAGLRPCAETKFRKQNQTKLPRDVYQTEAYTIVVSSCQRKGFKVKKGERQGVGVRERKRTFFKAM
jgi:hypothetical protein